MINNYIKRFGTLCIPALLLATSGVRADDTEIYFQGANQGTTPVVMFYIEYSPNLTSTICTGVNDVSDIDSQCPQMSNLKLYLSKPNTDSGSDFYNPTASNDFKDGVIDQFEMTRAALKYVLAGLGPMKVGLVTAHNNNSGCAGPDKTGCSNGAQIYERAVLLKKVSDIVPNFNPLSKDNLTTLLSSDDNKRELFKKLDRMRSPQGYFNAPNQNKEVYFELYRYLTGKRVYNGHNGWTDFGTSATYNLGDWELTNPNGRYICYTGTCTNADSGGIYTDAAKSGNSYKGDFDGDFAVTSGSGASPTTYIATDAFKWDTAAESVSQDANNKDIYTYISPLDTNCQKAFMVNLVDGSGIQANDSDTAIKDTIANGGMNLNVSAGDVGFAEMATWLFDADLSTKESKQNVTSYFIAKHTDQVNAAALNGTGGATPALALSSNPQAVVDAINKVFHQILSVSTTFVAAAIPVNVFNRSEVIDNAYIALFQANASGAPQWVGNVKKLKLDIYQVKVPAGTDPVTGAVIYKTENRLQLIDTNPDNIDTDLSTTAIDPPTAIASDGRVEQTALTYWTNALGYDLYDNVSSAETVGRDGRSVARGGAGQQIPGLLSSTVDAITTHYEPSPALSTGSDSLNSDGVRTLYTDDNGSLIDLDWTNIDKFWADLVRKNDPAWAKANDVSLLNGDYYNDSPLSYADSAVWQGTAMPFTMNDEARRLMWFIRGSDATDVDGDGNNKEARRWMMGDPLHARPIPINYGARSDYTSSNPDIRIVVGSNDGFLRMFRNTNANGSESGKEVWAYMPRDLLHLQKQLMENNPTDPVTHPYGLDGAPTAYVVDNDGTIRTPSDPNYNATIDANDKVWVFFGLRRGGRAYYAMDLTDPDHPSLKWSINQDTPGFSELGYSFSAPVVRELDWGSGRKPVVIIGGGYDTNKDLDGLGTDDSIGNALFIIDANDGTLVWKAVKTASTGTSYVNSALVDSIPSEVTAYDATGDGLVDRIYVGDTGGSVWRVDMPGTNRSAWTMTKILELGRHYNSTVADDRRFFNAPDVVPTRDVDGLFDAVVIGSGNREHPLATGTNDFLYTYKDRGITGLASGFTALDQTSLTDITHLNDCLIAGTCSPNLHNGWKLQLTVNGEKSLSSALTLRGVVYFNSYIPKTTACGPNEGGGRLYEVALGNGTAVYNFTTVNDVADGEVLGEQDRFRELASGGIPAENVYVSFKQGDETFTGILAPDLNAGQDLGVQSWNTYWFEKQK